MKKTLRVGMIGAGQVAYGHCNSINKHPQAKVTAVADLSKKRVKAISDKFEIEKQYPDWKSLVKDPDLDAVSIALPNALHMQASLDALRAGKHVLLDKPFALNAREAKRVIDAARKKRRVFMMGMNQRYQREVQTIHKLVKRGELGEIYHAKAYWYRRSGSPKFGTWFCNKELAGGGCMLDIGVHILDRCLYMMDNWQPISVSGQTYTKFGNRGIGEGGWGMSDRGKHIFDVEDFATALVRFKNGATLELNVSWIINQETPNKEGVELFGTKAGATLGPARLFRFAKKEGEYEVVEPQNVRIDYPHQDRHANWINTILRKEKPSCTAKQSLVTQKIIDAVYKSGETGREVRIR